MIRSETGRVFVEFMEALSYADIIFVMKAGKIVQQGSPETVYQTPKSPYIA
jgi:ABC-type Fe3+/spermidine/putrescine transport system ATPase subunit